MQFSLRTIFIIFTTVAVYTAFHAALYQTANISTLSVSLGFNAALTLPLFVLWVLATAWVYQHRGELKEFRLVLIALLLCIGDKILGEILITIAYRSINSVPPSVAWIFTLRTLLHVAIQFTTWALVLLAYVRANKSKQAETLSPWLPDEPAAPER
jgi:hypothetical protein